MKKLSNVQTEQAIENLEDFTTNTGSLSGRMFGGYGDTPKYYQVYSYSTLMLEFRIVNGKVYITDSNMDIKYSRTTSKHQNYIRKALTNMFVRDITKLTSLWEYNNTDMTDIEEIQHIMKEMFNITVSWDKASEIFNRAYFNTENKISELAKANKSVNFMNIYYTERKKAIMSNI